MKKLLTATVLVAIVMLSGCLSALHPLFTEEDLVFDPKLVGSWQAGPDNKVYTFQQGTAESFGELPEGMQKIAPKAYLLTITSSKQVKKQTNIMHSWRVSESICTWIIIPLKPKERKHYPAFYKTNFVQMHSFYRLQAGKDTEHHHYWTVCRQLPAYIDR